MYVISSLRLVTELLWQCPSLTALIGKRSAIGPLISRAHCTGEYSSGAFSIKKAGCQRKNLTNASITASRIGETLTLV